MPIYTIPLLYKKTITSNIVAFYFEKPKAFSFHAGQYGGFTLIDPPKKDDKGMTRRFSLLSTPYDTQLAIATRIQSHSTYKYSLNQLSIGQYIKLAGPSGQFVLHTDQSIPAVLIAGGVGIVPFHSMIQTAMQTASRLPIQLFYACQQLKEAAFLGKLQELEANWPYFQCIPIMAERQDSWMGEAGLLNQTILIKYLRDNIIIPIYYLCGSASFVKAVQQLLLALMIPQDRIKIEDFPGY